MTIGLDTNSTIYSVETQNDPRVSQLEKENQQLQKELEKLETQNQSLQGRLSSALQNASRVELSTNTQTTDTRETSEQTNQFFQTSGISIANESQSFEKQSVLSQAGSFIASQANASTHSVQKLLA